MKAVNQVQRIGYSVKEFAQALSLSEWSIRQAIKTGEVKVMRWGRRVIIPATEVQRLFNYHPAPQA